uniref:Secreted protein n=1 Tax=Panagrellus redivivus TaxID=6233 RepID=A0A7E4V918_PANRE
MEKLDKLLIFVVHGQFFAIGLVGPLRSDPFSTPTLCATSKEVDEISLLMMISTTTFDPRRRRPIARGVRVDILLFTIPACGDMRPPSAIAHCFFFPIATGSFATGKLGQLDSTHIEKPT